MTTADRRHVTVEDGGRVLARADVQCDAQLGTVQASLHVEAGHLPPGTRARLVDAVLDLPDLPTGAHLHAALPTGDAEILDRVRERCTLVELRAAGASCLLDGTLPVAEPADPADP